MKSITKKISLLALLSAVLFLSSCLDSGDNSYFGHDEYSYIAQSESGTVYARTASGHLITSPKISLLSPGTVSLLTFEVTDETESITLDGNINIFKVNLRAEPITLKQENLQLTSAPIEEDTIYFENILAPNQWVTNSSQYFGDRWPFTYQYKAKKGEDINIRFYLVDEEEIPEDANTDILIDIRLKKSGTPEPNSQEEEKADNIVVNLSYLRSLHSGNSTSEGSTDSNQFKDMRVKFRFFRSDKTDKLHISDRPIVIRI